MSVVDLRAVTAADLTWLDEWVASVAASVGYDALASEHPGASLIARIGAGAPPLARIIERDNEPVGIIICSLHAPRPGAAIIEIVATKRDAARRGSGMAAAAAIEDELRTAGLTTIFAPAPAVHGIDVYFWIRLGYRPIARNMWPCETAGVAWLQRDLDPRSTID